MTDHASNLRPRFRAFLALTVISVMVLGIFYARSGRVERQLIEARRALHKDQYARAGDLAREILVVEPRHADGLMIAAVSAAELGRFEQAVDFCRRVPNKTAHTYAQAQVLAGNLLLERLGQPSSAEPYFRRAAAADPSGPVALKRLAFLLSLQTRTAELIPIQLQRLRQNQVSPPVVLSLVQGDLLFPDARLLAKLKSQAGDDPGLLLGESRVRLLEQDFLTAEQLLRAALKKDPGLVEARVRLGQVLLDRNAAEELSTWSKSLPSAALAHPQTWIILGQLAERRRDHRAAARCYWEAGLKDAASLSACYLLGQQLSSLGRDSQATRFLDRARALERYRKLFDSGAEASLQWTPDLLHSGHEVAASLGLTWEAWAFAELAQQLQPGLPWAVEASHSTALLLRDLPLQRTAPQADPFQTIDLSEYRLPEVESETVPRAADSTDVDTPRALFERGDMAVGISFQFDNGVDSSISGAQRPYDFTGGGIAAVDYDADGWPDLYFSQGCRLDDDTGLPQQGPPDLLYRNLRGTTFDAVSAAGIPADPDYSQGVAAGDFNNDGFQDLFIANLGRNRLLLNNGDGTFSDVSSSIQQDEHRWTTSCLICDLNGDQWPDLYTVNYLSGDIVSRICRDETGRKNSCAPQDFPASQDQLFLGDGAGQFVDATSTSGVQVPLGKGLGVVATDLNEDGQLDLFVANDGVPNFLFERVPAGPRLFNQVAMERGVAVNRSGISEACMGVVAEDLNRDGRTDLFVTNFLDETNTLFAGSDVRGFFQDTTVTTGLGPPSLPVLGFGVQTLDAELDGHPDLVVVNGHVDDFRDRDKPYAMPPQYFRNLGGMRFQSHQAGGFFSGEYLGRSVVRLDWNRDGAEEVAIGLLGEPSALLRNITPGRGNSVSIVLHATTMQRDAIGTSVAATTAHTAMLRRSLIAGDGYQASNERMLVFGLYDQRQIAELQIDWLGAGQDVINNVAAGKTYAVIEGRRRLYEVPR
ncbi:MAG: FG-GAP-like repeat-containing protein [Fuerstiella sp.]